MKEELGEHNKFSDDNILRKCKHVILDSVLIFIIIIDDLHGMNQVLKEGKIDNGDEEYCDIFNYFINNYENIIMAKQARRGKNKKVI